MEPRSAARTYGAVEDPTAGKHKEGSAATKGTYQATPKTGANTAERSGRRSWLTVTLICAMGVGTIMAASRSGFSSSVSSPSTAAAVADGASGASRGSLLAEQLPASAVGPILSAPVDALSDPVVTGSVEAATGGLDFTVTNFYHERDGRPGAEIPWLKNVKFAEPHRDTTFTAVNARDGYTYEWSVQETKGNMGVLSEATGAVATMQFTRLDSNTVTVVEKDAEGNVTREMSDTVTVKYVRREIRTLTDDEREELLDSMLQVWKVRVDGGNGKEIYGDDYADIWVINRLHFKAASPLFCDHFHDGLGFLTSHAMLTNTFEYSLQKVNPKLTVPYWDFTIEKSSFGGNQEDIIEPQASSPLLSPDWFGTNDPEDGMVKDGRWAYTEIPLMKVNNPGGVESDVYSKLRAPWNVNDRAYLTRGMGSMCGVRVEEKYPWPNCASHYDLNTMYSDFYSWVWSSLYDPHGPVHVWLGGVLDCDETYAKLKDLVGPNIATNLAYFSFVHRKNLYRTGLFTCEGSFDVSTKPAELFKSGHCGCLNSNLESGDDYITIRDQIVFLTDYIDSFDADTQRRVVATICNGLMNDGDHLQASSSLDPTFWVTHPTMERLWMFKRLTGTMTDLSWPDEDTVYTNDNGETVRESLSLYDETCNGHRGKDVFPFGLGSDEGSTGFMARTGIRGDNDAGNTINNRDLLQLLDPRLDGLNYIYDTFEWKHCAADGFDMNDTWKTDRSESISRSEKRPSFKEGNVRYPLYNAFKNEAGKQRTSKKVDV